MTSLPLTPADFLVGLASVPLRIVSKEFFTEPGEPDALHVVLSDGSAWILRYDRDLACSLRVYRCHWEFEEEATWESTRLSFATLDGLREELRQKFAEDMDGVEVES